MTKRVPIFGHLTGLLGGFARQPAEVELAQIRPEKREVRGSMPRPTTGKAAQFNCHFDFVSVSESKSCPATCP
jgi:hypothetical protein